MLSEANLLILDEPTNHLDILSKEILEDALNHYTGTVLYVSHDRYFINRTASRILELSGKGLTSYLGIYDYYMEKKQELAQTAAEAPESNAAAPPEKESASKLDWKEQKELQARLRKRENELKRIEDRIERLENRDAELDTLMSQPDVCTNVARLQELSLEKETISEELTELMERWEALGAEE